MSKINYKTELKNIIGKSNIIDEQKKLWAIFLSKSMPLEDEAVYEAVSEGEENLLLLSNNLHDKVLAMITGSEKAWNKVLEDEKKYLELFD